MCWRAEAQRDLSQHLYNLTIADAMLHVKGFSLFLRKKGKQREAVIDKQDHFLQEQVFVWFGLCKGGILRKVCKQV